MFNEIPRRKHGMRRHGSGAKAAYRWEATREVARPWSVKATAVAEAGPLDPDELRKAFSKN